jgi:hypothetical protein
MQTVRRGRVRGREVHRGWRTAVLYGVDFGKPSSCNVKPWQIQRAARNDQRWGAGMSGAPPW